jgi:hypothetical protein
LSVCPSRAVRDAEDLPFEDSIRNHNWINLGSLAIFLLPLTTFDRRSDGNPAPWKATNESATPSEAATTRAAMLVRNEECGGRTIFLNEFDHSVTESDVREGNEKEMPHAFSAYAKCVAFPGPRKPTRFRPFSID